MVDFFRRQQARRQFLGGGVMINRYMGVEPKIGGNTPEMDGENTGKPYLKLDDLGENPLFSETSICDG